MDNWNIHNEMYSISRVALLLNCSVPTIKRWYKYARLNDEPIEMPQYTTDNKGTWYFKHEQILELQNFRKKLKWGQMSKFNEKYYWSKKKGKSNDN